jgi:tight adherence protein B
MLENPRLITNIIGTLAAFGVLSSIWLATLLVLSLRRSGRARAMEQRLGLSPGTEDGSGRVLRLWHDGRLASTVVRGGDGNQTLGVRIHLLFQRAGFEGDPKPFVLATAGSALLVGALGFAALQNIVLAVAAAGGVVMVAWFYLGRRIKGRERVFDTQFVDAMGLAARSLRAGHPLLGAFQMISQELGDPVRGLFAGICQQHAMGLKLEEAIARVAAESANRDVKLFSTAITIQLRSGGNLADVMERLADVIRDRVRIGRRVKVLTAQTQFSKNVLLALPIILFLLLQVINPEYMAPLIHEPMGRFLLGTMIVNIILGMIVMNRVSVLKY